MSQKKITDLQTRDEVEDDLYFPVDDTIQSYKVSGRQIFNYMRPLIAANLTEIANLGFATSVSGNALTIAVKTNAGTDASVTDKARVAFRSATLTSGVYNLREISAALSMVVSSGSTLGQVSAQPSYIWVYLLDNAGTPELAVSHSRYREDELISTTAEGGAGAADSATVIYSTTARSNVPIRLIGYILNTQTTAGTWASAGTQLQMVPLQPKRLTRQILTSGTTYYTPAGCIGIYVRGVGAGGGGQGGNGAGGTGTSGTNGGNTTFGSSLLTANGGLGGVAGGGGTVATVTVNSPAIDIASQPGSQGAAGTFAYVLGGSGNGGALGGAGGSSPFAGAGQATTGGSGTTAVANSGSGGGGGSVAAGNGIQNAGQGGHSGAYFEAYIENPLASYTYAIGASGGGGGNGGAGAAGKIIVEEYY